MVVTKRALIFAAPSPLVIRTIILFRRNVGQQFDRSNLRYTLFQTHFLIAPLFVFCGHICETHWRDLECSWDGYVSNELVVHHVLCSVQTQCAVT